MRVLTYKILVSAVFIAIITVIGGLFCYVDRQDQMAHNENTSVQQSEAAPAPAVPPEANEPVQKASAPAVPPKSLFEDIWRHRAV
jgi:hypothetical protein